MRKRIRGPYNHMTDQDKNLHNFDPLEIIRAKASNQQGECQYCYKNMMKKHIGQHIRTQHLNENQPKPEPNIPPPKIEPDLPKPAMPPIELNRIGKKDDIPCEKWDKRFTSVSEFIMHTDFHLNQQRTYKSRKIIAEKKERKYGNARNMAKEEGIQVNTNKESSSTQFDFQAEKKTTNDDQNEQIFVIDD